MMATKVHVTINYMDVVWAEVFRKPAIYYLADIIGGLRFKKYDVCAFFINERKGGRPLYIFPIENGSSFPSVQTTMHMYRMRPVMSCANCL